jgi:4-hydroxybenzoate polyprenyltransferase
MIRLPIYAQLVRLPNLPSALSNICLGALATGALPDHWLPFVLLLPASACFYCGGMVWNDFFDREQDRHERPSRPLPAGKISPREAAVLGAALLSCGVLFAGLAGWSQPGTDNPPGLTAPLQLALLLVAAILLYDSWLKRTSVGPVSMGLCRFLNVLLGVSASGTLAWPLGAHLALVVGLYVTGVTWFARTEARASKKSHLRGAAGVMLAGLSAAIFLPLHVAPGTASVLFYFLLVLFGFAVGLPLSRAIASPTPSNVQAAVKRVLLGLIVLDAILASAVAGTIGLVILVLLAPALYLNRMRWLYAT